MFAINDMVFVIPPLHYKLKPEYVPCKVVGISDLLGDICYLIEFPKNSANNVKHLNVEEACLVKVPEVKVGDMVLINADAKRWIGWISSHMDPHIGTTREVIEVSSDIKAVLVKGGNGYYFHKSCIEEVIPAIKPSSSVPLKELMSSPVALTSELRFSTRLGWVLDERPTSPKLPNPPEFLTDSQKILNDLEARFSTLYSNKEK